MARIIECGFVYHFTVILSLTLITSDNNLHGLFTEGIKLNIPNDSWMSTPEQINYHTLMDAKMCVPILIFILKESMM